MLMELRYNVHFWKCQVRSEPHKVFLCPCILLMIALFVRLFSGSSAYLYNLLVCRGMFPGVILYTLMRMLRILCAGGILSAAFFAPGLYERRGKTLLPAAVICIVLLSEYRMLFFAIHPGLTLFLCILSVLAAIRCLRIFLRGCCPGTLPTLCFLLLQSVFAVQLASLCIAL